MSDRILTAWGVGLCLAVLIGCSAAESPGSISPSDDVVAIEGTAIKNLKSHAATEVDTAHRSQPTTRQVILKTEIEVSVEDLSGAHEKLRLLVQGHDATITNSTMSALSGVGAKSVWTLRVAPGKYEPLLTELGALGEIQHRQESSQDVTDVAVDMEARIRNKTQEEARLLSHLNTSTGNLEEILRVEKEISRVREELERMQGQLATLKDRVDWATITMTLNQARVGASNHPISFVSQAKQAWTGSWSALMVVCRAGMIALIAVFPWALCGGIPAVVIWSIRNRWFRFK